MKKIFYIFIFLFTFTGKIYSGTYSDNLAQCMINNISDTDNRILTNWMASVMIQHPQIEITMSPEDREYFYRSAATLLEDLLTIRCKEETIIALTFESDDAFANAFEILGIVSMETLIAHPDVIQASEELIDYIDLEKFTNIFD